MGSLILFGLLFLAYVFLYPLYLGSKIHELRVEIEKMKLGSRNVAQAPQVHKIENVHTAQSPVQSREPSPVVPTSQVIPDHSVLAPAKDPLDRFITWLKKDFLVKLGAFLLLIGFGWFVSYAFANNWIGPAGRIALGLIAGVAILALGAWRIRTYLHQGAIFVVLGSSTVLLTVYTARHLYDFFTPLSALVMMFLSICFVAFLSVRYKSLNLSFAGLVLGALAPLFTDTPTPDVLGLSLYLLVLVLGTLWVVYLTGWKELTFGALLVVSIYGLPYLGVSGGDRDIALLFSFIFTGIFFTTNIASIIHQKEKIATQIHIVIAGMTGLYLIVWVTAAAGEEWQSLLYVAWMLVFSVGSYLVCYATTNRGPFFMYAGTSIALLAAATAAELHGPALTIAYTLETGVIVALSQYLLRNIGISERLSVLFVGPALLSLQSIASPLWYSSVIHDDLFVLVVLSLTLTIAGLLLLMYARRPGHEENKVAWVLIVGASMYGLILIWLITHALYTYDVATMLALIVYTLIGLLLYIKGRMENLKLMWVLGSVLLGAVIVRLLLVEIWNMVLTGRIVTFFVIGALLISTAFIGRKKSNNPDVT